MQSVSLHQKVFEFFLTNLIGVIWDNYDWIAVWQRYVSDNKVACCDIIRKTFILDYSIITCTVTKRFFLRAVKKGHERFLGAFISDEFANHHVGLFLRLKIVTDLFIWGVDDRRPTAVVRAWFPHVQYPYSKLNVQVRVWIINKATAKFCKICFVAKICGNRDYLIISVEWRPYRAELTQ